MTKLAIRELQPNDAYLINKYWEETTDEDLARMGEVRRPDPKGTIEFINEYCAKRLPPSRSEEEIVIWMCENNPIGYCTLKQIKYGDEAQIHIHMWERTLRGKGLGSILFCLSAKKYIGDFQLKNLYCQPKHDNAMPNGMLKRVGFEFLGTVDWTHPRNGSVIRQNRYQISPTLIETFLNSMRESFDF